MKNNKGISLITLLITVIVIIIIASISAYSGKNLVNDTREKDAEDKLKTICSAILKDDTFLKFSGDTAILSEEDFDYMDLLKYYDEKNEVKVSKKETKQNNTKNIEYKLVMLNKETSGEYTYTFDYNVYVDKYNNVVSFDESKGVNRPILISGDKEDNRMIALMPDGATEVEDVYTSNWYNYEKGISSFAKMKYKDKVYVWIPRFAYDIQNFYEGRNQKEIPTSAINIVFLRENTNYMANGEVIEGEYKVHPAFSANGIEYSGIWVEKQASEEKSKYLDINIAEDNMHLMTSRECGASIYLMYALDSLKEIDFSKDEYVCSYTLGDIQRDGKVDAADAVDLAQVLANWDKEIEGIDVIADINNDGLIDKLDAEVLAQYLANWDIDLFKNNSTIGEGISETPWNRILSENPSRDETILIRKFSSGIFDYEYSGGSDEVHYRSVIRIK